MDEVFLQIVGRQRLVGDFTQRNDGVLVIIAVDGDRSALRNLASAMACTSSKRLSTLSMQSSTVTRAIACPLRVVMSLISAPCGLQDAQGLL